MPKKNGQPTKRELREIELQKKINDVDYLLENAELLNWSKISSKFELSDEVLEKCARYISWSKLSSVRHDLDINLLIKNYKRIGVFNLLTYQKHITIELIDLMKPKMTDTEWSMLSRRFLLPMGFIERYYENLFLELLDISHLTNEEKEKFDALVALRKLS